MEKIEEKGKILNKTITHKENSSVLMPSFDIKCLLEI